MFSRDLNDLDPRFKPFADQFLSVGRAQGLNILIYCTYRPCADQDELYAQGRDKPGKIVTWARGGQSPHNYGLAFDGCPTIHGKPLWDEPLDGPHWTQYGVLARSVGLEWGGDWSKGKREGPHCQHPSWKRLAGLA